MKEIIAGLLVPFLGTSLGAACVFFLKKELNYRNRSLGLRQASW